MHILANHGDPWHNEALVLVLVLSLLLLLVVVIVVVVVVVVDMPISFVCMHACQY